MRCALLPHADFTSTFLTSLDCVYTCVLFQHIVERHGDTLLPHFLGKSRLFTPAWSLLDDVVGGLGSVFWGSVSYSAADNSFEMGSRVRTPFNR